MASQRIRNSVSVTLHQATPAKSFSVKLCMILGDTRLQAGFVDLQMGELQYVDLPDLDTRSGRNMRITAFLSFPRTVRYAE